MSATIAIGFFDGVHLGHRKILAGAEIAVTFKNHPATVLNPAKAPKLIMSFADRVEAIRACGVHDVLALDFTPELASLTPERFLELLEFKLHFQPQPPTSTAFSLRCGANWRFGKNAAGSPEWLRQRGIPVEVIEAAVYDNAPVSSTRIRECLSRGEIAAANAMLGHRFRVVGDMVQGKGEGRNIGYPTLNLRVNLQDSDSSSPCSLVELPLGVYQVDAAGKRAVANYGFAPTFGDRAWKTPMLEVHFAGSSVIDFQSAGFGEGRLEVEFLKFIRPERKFDSVDELRRQIASDITEALSGD